jgi:hypothetical protein
MVQATSLNGVLFNVLDSRYFLVDNDTYPAG